MDVLISDSNFMFSFGMKKIIEAEMGLSVQTVQDSRHNIFHTLERNPTLFVIDDKISSVSFKDIREFIIRNYLDTKVVILTTTDKLMEQHVTFVKEGAQGLLPRSIDIGSMLYGLQVVINGHVYIHHTLMTHLLSYVQMNRNQNKAKQPEEHYGAPKKILSKREYEVLMLLSEGLSNNQIAHELNISTQTVKNHIRNIFFKLGVETRTQAIIKAIKNGWVPMPSKTKDEQNNCNYREVVSV